MKLVITDITDFQPTVAGEYRLIKPQGKIHPCVGCFGCWVRMPGKCVIHDGYECTGVEMSRCSELILISRCCCGSPSPFVKTVLDRALSYLHPDFVIRRGEMHHKRRYRNVIALSAHLYGADITEREKQTARKLLEANADNYDGVLRDVQFYQTAEALEGIKI